MARNVGVSVYASRNEDVQKIYNPVGKINELQIRNKDKYIGVLSMFAPWKGIHQIIWACLIYENELRARGFMGLKVFGGEIYQTMGEHEGYEKQLKDLCSNFNSKGE